MSDNKNMEQEQNDNDIFQDVDFLKDIEEFNNSMEEDDDNQPDNLSDNYDDYLNAFMGSDDKQKNEESKDELNFDDSDLDSILDLLDMHESENKKNDEDLNNIKFVTDSDNSDNSIPSNNATDMSDIFSDVLGAVSPEEPDITPDNNIDMEEDLLDSVTNLADSIEQDIKDMNNQAPATDMKSDQKKDKEKKPKKEKKSEKEKPSLLIRLFGNVKDDKPKKVVPELSEEEKLKLIEKKKEEKNEAKKKKTLEKKAKSDEKKKQKLQVKEQKKEKIAQKKAEKAKLAAEAPVEVDEGRINRVGASIVVGFFAILTLIIVFGSRSVSYNSSVTNATNYFNGDHYRKAYDEIAGVDVKKEDKEILKQIRTVMYVEKQLESYRNYSSLKLYPQALDSLLKGIDRYDKYIGVAKKLGVDNDLNSIKKQMVTALQKNYKLSEKEARSIVKIKNHEEYSKHVIQVAQEK